MTEKEHGDKLIYLVIKLSDGFEEQLSGYGEMLILAKEQLALCSQATFSRPEDLASLNQLLAKRQEQLALLQKENDKLDKVKEELAHLLQLEEVNLSGLRTKLEQVLGKAGVPQQIAKLEEMLAFLGRLLQEINKIDQASQGEMQEKLTKIAPTPAGGGKDNPIRKKVAHRAYQQQPKPPQSPKSQ